VGESRVIQLQQQMVDFRNSDRDEHPFPPGLDNHERCTLALTTVPPVPPSTNAASPMVPLPRATLHESARKMGLHTKSTGKGEARFITVWRDKPKVAEAKGEDVPVLKFTEDSLMVMQDHFEAWPLQEDGKEVVSVRDAAPAKRLVQDTSVGRRNRWPPNKEQWKQKCAAALPNRKRLPSFAAREDLLAAVKSNQVVLISGETGCGKTTQVPQFIMDEAIESGAKECNIICTQPRRIAALSVAERVASERGERCGESVGYSIRLDTKVSNQTCLTFCTTGVLLRRLTSDHTLSNVTHIILDEVHERDRFCDFAMIFLRELLPRRPDLRVILMSATLTAELFKEYFYGCPVVHIPGFTHPVEQLWLEETLMMIGYNAGKGGGGPRRGGGTHEEEMALALQDYQSVNKLDEVDVRLIEQVVKFIHSSQGPGAVLVFLPGWDEILRLRESLGAIRGIDVLCLHSMISAQEQRRVFQPPRHNMRKVVLATNIAETSITIDDIVYVLNSGRHKEKSFDAHSAMSTLQTEWISKNSERQRKGRAGRCQPGKCYHLFSKARSESLPQSQVAELLRTPLEELSLQVQLLQPGEAYPGSISDFLGKAVEPPVPRAISSAVAALQQLGALTPREELTELGVTLGKMPVHPRMGKMVCLSLLFDCLDPILTIACGSGQRDPFTTPTNPEQRRNAKEAKAAFTAGCASDQFTFLRCYDRWAGEVENRGHQGGTRFCSQNFLSNSSLEVAKGARGQLIGELADNNFLLKLEGSERRQAGDNLQARGLPGLGDASAAVVGAVLCAGLHPNVAQVRAGVENLLLQNGKEPRMRVHMSSVNTSLRVDEARGMWCGFDEAVRGDGGVSVRGTTMIPAAIATLLALDVDDKENSDGEEEVDEETGLAVPIETISVDGWCKMRAAPGVGVMVRTMKARLERAFLAKMKNPLEPLQKMEADVVATAVRVFEAEARAGASPGFCQALSYKARGRTTGGGGSLGEEFASVYQDELRMTQLWSRTEEDEPRRGGKGGKGGRPSQPLSAEGFASAMDALLGDMEAEAEEAWEQGEDYEVDAGEEGYMEVAGGMELGFEFNDDGEEQGAQGGGGEEEEPEVPVVVKAKLKFKIPSTFKEFKPAAAEVVQDPAFTALIGQIADAKPAEAGEKKKEKKKKEKEKKKKDDAPDGGANPTEPPKEKKKKERKKKEKKAEPAAFAVPMPLPLGAMQIDPSTGLPMSMAAPPLPGLPMPIPGLPRPAALPRPAPAAQVNSAEDAMAVLRRQHQAREAPPPVGDDDDDDDDICFIPS